MAELTGNCLVGLSGGPTCVVNASLAGIISEALNHESIEEIYGALDGISGVLNEELVDLAAESQQTIRGLYHTPGAALGAAQHRLKKSQDLERLLQVFEAHDIRYFFYTGNNESLDAADRISRFAEERGYDLRVIGIPATIHNDLTHTDHCPGYGSAIKHIAATVRGIACDHEAAGQHDLVSIIEVAGRSSGWIAAGASLAKRKDQPHDAPHLICLPEVPFSPEKFRQDVQRILRRRRFCLIVVAEGLVDQDGNYITTVAGDGGSDVGSAGVGDFLRRIVEEELGLTARCVRLGDTQRSAMGNASKTDSEEAFLAGRNALLAALEGESGRMVTILRGETEHYSCETGLASFSDVARGNKVLPGEWIHEDGISMNHQFAKYAQPLIQGEVTVPFESGLPSFVQLKKTPVKKKLEAYQPGEATV